MALKRCLLEMGMGVDLHGRDYTQAAQRAVTNALWHNSLYFTRSFGAGPESMRVDVTIAVPEPDAVNGDAVLSVLPYGQKHINVVKGGLEIPNEDGSDATVMANAAVLVSLDV
ncbi:MAG: Lin0512 family protein [Dehalococcoidia bacterium]|nr:Lin0512 family protein [Dehalococcoidia bacterium]